MMINDDFIRMNPEEKNQLQLERLQSTLNRAYRNVPFHKKRFKEMGIDLSQIESLSDIARLPFMERQNISENYPYNLFAVPLRDIVRIHTAPGTTHNPTVSGYTSQDLSNWQSILARALQASEISVHDILQITLNPGLANWGRDYKYGAEAIEASVIPHTPMSIEKKLMVLRDYKTSALITTPSSALQLANYVRKNEININVFELKTLILIGEAIDEDDQRSLEQDLHVIAWAHYGLSEVPGPAIAFECDAHEGLHINEDHFLPEIVDPETGKVLPEGQSGELILTTLTTRAFPLIRFKTGDKAKIISHPCACGRGLCRIKWRGDRTDDLINIDGIKIHKKQIQLTIQSLLDLPSDTSKFFIKKQDERKYIEVWIPVNDAIFSDEIKELEALIHRAEKNLLENIGVPVAIRLKEKGMI
ncbi:MAG: phenylacetate--CoA ligase [Desulfobacteraceae bacterium]|nr:phenylacetate--CoA ligase family protein [Desulfobacteraceae bacterium]MBC2756711.1 phenylacetate--CoA ligase [Desulfobacteraceae bacterium]